MNSAASFLMSAMTMSLSCSYPSRRRGWSGQKYQNRDA
jgi:hypothetical protein